jgi:hypothetical protein
MRSDVVGIAGVWFGAAVLYSLLGALQTVPLVSPDEFIYGHLAQSLAAGDGFTWRGDPVGLHAALWVYMITPAWLGVSAAAGYGIAKVIAAVVVSSVCVPVWLLARTMLTPRLSLLAAGLAVAGTWMTTAALLLTENLGLPLATAALVTAVQAVRHPGSRSWTIALAFAALATWARLQLVVLVPVLFAAVAADVLRAPADQRKARAVAHRGALLGTGLISLVGLVSLALNLGDVAGMYSSVSDFRPSISASFAAIGRQFVTLTVMTGVVPVVVLVALAVRRAAWADPVIGPLLCVGVPSVLLFAAQSGWFVAGFGLDFPIQRYIEYAVPLTLVLMVVGVQRRDLLAPAAWYVAGALAVATLLGAIREPLEGRALYSVVELGSLFGASTQVAALVLVGLLAFGGTFLVLRAQDASRAAWVGGALVLGVLALQSANGWLWQIHRTHEWRATFPSDLSWIDHAAPREKNVARLLVSGNHSRWETIEFFNQSVSQVYAPQNTDLTGRSIQGRTCLWSIGGDGRAEFAKGCGSPPKLAYVDDPAARLTFEDGRYVRRTRSTGSLISLPASPNLKSLVVLPCDDRSLLNRDGKVLAFADRVCRSVFTGLFWLERPGTLVLQVRGGNDPHSAQVGERSIDVPPNQMTTIRVRVKQGATRIDIPFDTQELPGGYPDVTGAVLEEPDTTTNLL